MIDIRLSKEAETFIREMKGAEARLNRGAVRLLAFVAERAKAGIIKRAGTEIPVDYTKLQIIRIGRLADVQVAIVMPDESKSLSASDLSEMAIYVEPQEPDKRLELLAEHSPWAATHFPTGLPPSAKMRLIGRRADREALDDIIRTNNTSGVRRLLELNGLEYTTDRTSLEWEVEEDLLWIVTRKELGIDTEAVPHWRPSIKGAHQISKANGEALARYILTGRWRGFTAVPRAGNVDLSKVEAFQKLLGLL